MVDPFSGAGTTGIVAKKFNRKAILIELNPEGIMLLLRKELISLIWNVCMIWLLLGCVGLGYIIATRNEIIIFIKMQWKKWKEKLNLNLLRFFYDFTGSFISGIKS